MTPSSLSFPSFPSFASFLEDRLVLAWRTFLSETMLEAYFSDR